jgi:hypothetical protein
MLQYVELHRPNLHDLLDGYQSATFPEALKAAFHGKYPPNGMNAGKRHPHQRRISNEALQQWAAKLGKAQARIQAFRGQAFEDLFDFINEQASAVSGLGPLMVYDTALRIGANIDCLPKDWVYLHAHARIPGVGSGVRRIKKSKLPEALKALEDLDAYEIEDFLCIYHDPIVNLISRS